MSIKINSINRSEEQMIQTQMPSIKINGIESIQKSQIKISARTDVEDIPGPDKHTNDSFNLGHHDEFHFLKSIIIDNELF